MTKPILILPSDLRHEADRAKQLEKELAEKESTLREQYIENETLRKQNEALKAELASYK